MSDGETCTHADFVIVNEATELDDGGQHLVLWLECRDCGSEGYWRKLASLVVRERQALWTTP